MKNVFFKLAQTIKILPKINFPIQNNLKKKEKKSLKSSSILKNVCKIIQLNI